MNRKTAFLGETLKFASKTLLYYIVLLGIIVYGFFAMAHVAFGKSL